MIKVSKIILEPNEIVLCDECKEPLTTECAETSFKPGYFHQSCAIGLDENNRTTDIMAFYDDAKEYAKAKGE